MSTTILPRATPTRSSDVLAAPAARTPAPRDRRRHRARLVRARLRRDRRTAARPGPSPSRRPRRLAGFLQPGEVVTATDDGQLVLRLRRGDRGARPVRLQEMAYHAIEVFDRLGFHAGVLDLGVGWAPISRKQGPEEAQRQAARAAARLGRPARLPAAPARRPRPRPEPVGQPLDRGPPGPGRHARQPRAAVPRPRRCATSSASTSPDVLYWALVGVAAAHRRRDLGGVRPGARPAAAPRRTGPAGAARERRDRGVPPERGRHHRRDAARRSCAQEYAGGLQVVLAYNTPTLMPIEAELQQLAEDHHAPDRDQGPGLDVQGAERERRAARRRR